MRRLRLLLKRSLKHLELYDTTLEEIDRDKALLNDGKMSKRDFVEQVRCKTTRLVEVD